jgi:hypothetical protein
MQTDTVEALLGAGRLNLPEHVPHVKSHDPWDDDSD